MRVSKRMDDHSGLVHLAQNMLIVIGSAALGAVSVGFGLGFFVSLLFSPRGPEDYTSEVYSLGSLCCGGLLGAIVAFVMAIQAISRRENTLWPSTVWIFASTGLVAGFILSHFFIVPSSLPFRWFPSMIFSIAFSMASGLVATAFATLAQLGKSRE